MYRYSLLLLFVLLIGCSGGGEFGAGDQTALLDSLDVPDRIRQLENLTVYDPNRPPLNQISFTKELEYEQFDAFLAPPVGTGPKTAVDDRGNLYLTDQRNNNIRVYDLEGNLLQTIGREGRGPGEFLFISTITIYGDRLYAYDPIQIRIQPFDLDPVKAGRMINLDVRNFDGEGEYSYIQPRTEVFPYGEDQFIAGVSRIQRDGNWHTGYHVINAEGELASGPILELMQKGRLEFSHENGAAASMQLPAGREEILDAAPDGTIYEVNTGELLIRIYDPENGYRRAIYYPYENDPVEAEELREQYHSSQHDVILRADLPDTWPALADLFVDDENRIWVATVTDGKENHEWWVLENDGRLSARFTWSSDADLEVVKDGHLYVRVTDPETRGQHVERYEITLNPN